MSDPTHVERALGQWQKTLGSVVRWEPAHHKNTVFAITTEQNGTFVLKEILNRSPPTRLLAERRVLHHLDQSGVPVAVPCLTDDEQCYATFDARVFMLSPALPGGGEDEAIDIGKLYQNVGAAIGRLHRALAACPWTIESWEMRLPSRILDEAVPRILSRLTGARARTVESVVAAAHRDLAERLTDLPCQRIHGDCHGGNIVLRGEQVSGFIDLDHLPIGPRIYDIAYYLADRLKNALRDPEGPVRFLSTFDRVMIGYETEVTLTERERSALWPAMLAAEFLFVEWFLDHPDEAGLTFHLETLHGICRYRSVLCERLAAG